MKPVRLDRRTFLRGAGVAVALPALDVMLTDRGLFHSVAHAAGGKPPVRFLGFQMQNGCPKQWYSPLPVGKMSEPPRGTGVLTDFGGSVRYWDPATVGETYDLNVANKALVPYKDDFLTITGLHQRGLASVFEHSDGAVACLVGFPMHSKPLDGRAERSAAPSLDWVLGKSLGKNLPQPALYMGLRRDATDTTNRWYTCSWIGDEQPASCLDKPRSLADKLIPQMPATTNDPAAELERRRARSVLDFVKDDATKLQAKLGTADRARVDQHLTSLRELERQLAMADAPGIVCTGAAPTTPTGYLDDDAQMALMAKLIAFGFACDVFRYGVFHVQMAYPLPGKEKGHDHGASHEVMNRDNIYYWDKKMGWLATLIGELKKTPEAGGTLLDNSIVLTAVDVAVGAKHNFDDLPVMVAGRAGGQIKSGRHLHRRDVTVNNLYASLLTMCGLPTERYGVDGTGQLTGLGG